MPTLARRDRRLARSQDLGRPAQHSSRSLSDRRRLDPLQGRRPGRGPEDAHKQLELLVPSFSSGDSATKPVVAAWTCASNSLAITHNHHQGIQRYILWHAPTSRQANFADPADLNHALYATRPRDPRLTRAGFLQEVPPANPV